MSQYYRNIADLTSIEGIEVDQGSLWKLDTAQNLLILEDEDQYATAYLNKDFEEAL